MRPARGIAHSERAPLTRTGVLILAISCAVISGFGGSRSTTSLARSDVEPSGLVGRAVSSAPPVAGVVATSVTSENFADAVGGATIIEAVKFKDSVLVAEYAPVAITSRAADVSKVGCNSSSSVSLCFLCQRRRCCLLFNRS